MKIKSCVWYWLAAASGAVSLLYGMGIEGGAQLGSSISDSQFVTALCLVLAAVAFLRLGFAAQDREQNARRYGRIQRHQARTEEPDYPAEPEGRMTTKRMKKLLMGMGLSRNQVNSMVLSQRAEGSKKVSNELYYFVVKQDIPKIDAELLPYLKSFVLA